MSAIPDRIVAEVCNTWPKNPGEEILLCTKFEQVIAVNAKRGFELEDWKLSQLLTPNGMLTETIVAVFVRREAVSQN